MSFLWQLLIAIAWSLIAGVLICAAASLAVFAVVLAGSFGFGVFLATLGDA